MYTSFQKTQLELEQRLYSTNRGRYFPENELSVDEKNVNDANTYSYPQNENMYNLFYGDFWDSEALTSFYGSPINFSKEQPYGSLQIGDVKYSKYSFDLLLQIEKC